MADTKGSALPAMTTPVDGDIAIVVDDPAGTPATQSVSFTNMWTNYFKGKADALYAASGHNHDASYAAISHTHAAGDITSGTFGTARIADDAVTFPKLLNATQKALIGAGAAGAFSEITLGAGLDIAAGALDVVTNAAAASVTANTKSTMLDDDYFFCFDPDNANNDLKEYGLTFANFQTQLEGIFVTLTEINTQTGTAYTLALTDANDIVEADNAGANTVTIPTNAAVAFPVGTVIGVTQFGAGATTVTGDTGVTVNGVSAGGAAIDAQYKGVSIYKRDTDEWVMQGAHGTVT